MNASKKNVLIANHGENIVDLVKHSVSLHGYKVHKALNGRKALELIDKENINLIFLDLQISELNGLDILKKLKEKKYEIPVIMYGATKIEDSKDQVNLIGYEHVLGFVGEDSKTINDYLDILKKESI